MEALLQNSKLFSPTKLSMSQEELMFYYSLIRMTGVQSVVEVGTAYGVSAAWAAMALIDSGASGSVITVDIKDRRGSLVYEGTPVEPKIKTVVEDFNKSTTFRSIHRAIPRAQQPMLVLLDGANGYQEYKRAWDNVIFRLNPNDWVVAHDTGTMKGSNQLAHELGGRMMLFPGVYGIGVYKCLL